MFRFVYRDFLRWDIFLRLHLRASISLSLTYSLCLLCAIFVNYYFQYFFSFVRSFFCLFHIRSIDNSMLFETECGCAGFHTLSFARFRWIVCKWQWNYCMCVFVSSSWLTLLFVIVRTKHWIRIFLFILSFLLLVFRILEVVCFLVAVSVLAWIITRMRTRWDSVIIYDVIFASIFSSRCPVAIIESLNWELDVLD